MRALLYHQRYQVWNREPEVASRADGGVDARREEFTQARLGRIGQELVSEIELYLAFVALCELK
jgi:hypothetical protein